MKSTLFCTPEPASFDKPWILSHTNDPKPVLIPKDVTKLIKGHHLLGIQFLYEKFINKFQGAILNEEKGMNMPLQVSAFLRAICTDQTGLLILIVCPDSSKDTWEYHLSIHSQFKIGTREELIDPKVNTAFVLSFNQLKTVEDYLENEVFTVIIDSLDIIANKLITRKIRGEFNIGLTERNFYKNPDQKVQWSMLNWANRGCVGKLSEFYEIDKWNRENFVDNYHHWWFRLTWSFCESFQKPSEEEKQECLKSLLNWKSGSFKLKETEARKRKVDSLPENKAKAMPKNKLNSEQTSSSSSDTIIYEMESPKRISDYIPLPSMDESPILSSIIRNLEKSPEPIRVKSKFNYSFQQPTCSKAFVESELELLDDEKRAGTSKDEEFESAEEFLLSLVSSNESPVRSKKSD